MFRLLYKTLLISVMSGSLSIMNMTAFAQSSGNGMQKAQVPSGYSRDANGTVKKTDNVKFEGTKAGDDNAMHVITMLAVGVIGTKLLMYKKWTTDMTVVAAASAAYLAAEVVNILSLKNQLDDQNIQLTKSSDGKNDQAQIDSLQKLKESYEKVQKTAETKKMLQTAAAYAYMGALAIAAWNYFTEEGQFTSCMTALTNGEAALDACIASGATVVGTEEAGFCAACKPLVSALLLGVPKTRAMDKAAAGKEPSMVLAAHNQVMEQEENASLIAPCGGATAASVKTSIQGACTAYKTTKGLNAAFGSFVDFVQYKPSSFEKLLYVKAAQPNMSIDPTIGSRNLLQKALDAFFPRAEAGWISMLGLGAGAAAAFYAANTTMGRTIDTWMYTPGARIIAWTIMSAAAFMGADATQKEIDKIKDHIEDINKILNDMNKMQKGVAANNIQERQLKLAGLQAVPVQELPLNQNANVKTDCLNSNGNSNCPSLENQIKSMPGFADLPSSLQTIATQSAQLGSGLSGTNTVSGSALTSARNINNNANAIRKVTEQIKNKLNDQLAKNGKPKIDFDKEGNSLLNKLNANTAKAFQSKGMSASAFLASTGISTFEKPKTAAVESLPTAKKAMATGGLGAGAISSGKKDKGLEFDFKESGDGNVAVAGNAGAPAKDEKYDIGENDINTNSGESIFQMISNRYIKSGYPKLLEEIPVKN